MSLRWASFATLLALFGGMCYFGSGVSQTAQATLGQEVSTKVASLGSIRDMLNDLLATAYAHIVHLGSGALIGIGAALLLGYALFLALGAVYFRLAFAPSRFSAYENHQ
jgi:hypothetical protein